MFTLFKIEITYIEQYATSITSGLCHLHTDEKSIPGLTLFTMRLKKN